MKKKILISINPEHVQNIIKGIKKYEYRKIAAKQDISSIIIYGNIESGLCGLVCIFANSKMLDAVLYGGDKGKSIMIVSEKELEIAKAINNDVRRGVTLLSGQGAYSEQERKIVLCAVRDNQYPAVKRIVHGIDPNAFIIVNTASEILGTGFRPIELDK